MNALAQLVAVAWFAYFAPGDAVVAQLAAARAGQTPLHVEATLRRPDGNTPARLAIDLHPELGVRIAGDTGQRWVLHGGRAVAGTELPPPRWLPELEALALRRESDLRAWLATQTIDTAQNELARCGDGDCYVLGTRQSAAQLWVEKNAVEVRRVVLADKRRTSFDEWRSYEKTRFPARIEVANERQGLASLEVFAVTPAPPLSAADFSATWVQAAPPRR